GTGLEPMAAPTPPRARLGRRRARAAAGARPCRPMRILQVSTFDHAGGAEDIAYGLHRAWLERGHDPYMAVGVKHGDDPRVLTVPNLRTRPWLARKANKLEMRLRLNEPNGVRVARGLAVATDPRRYAEV